MSTDPISRDERIVARIARTLTVGAPSVPTERKAA